MNLGVVGLASERQFTILPNTPNVRAVNLLGPLPRINNAIDPVLQDQFGLQSVSLFVSLVKRFDLMVFHHSSVFLKGVLQAGSTSCQTRSFISLPSNIPNSKW